jgi:hypothetical protein
MTLANGGTLDKLTEFVNLNKSVLKNGYSVPPEWVDYTHRGLSVNNRTSDGLAFRLCCALRLNSLDR